MVAAHSPESEAPVTEPITNHIIKTLSTYGGVYKTFGENIILLLNRESGFQYPILPKCRANNSKAKPVCSFSY